MNLSAMECPVCHVRFGGRVDPIGLSCGHSVCRDDAKTLQSCPVCNSTLERPVPMVVNYSTKAVAELVSKQSSQPLQALESSEIQSMDLVNIECPICFDYYGGSIDPMLLKCGHTVCGDDVGGLKKCPICVTPINKSVPLSVNHSLKPIAEQLAELAQQQSTLRKFKALPSPPEQMSANTALADALSPPAASVPVTRVDSKHAETPAEVEERDEEEEDKAEPNYADATASKKKRKNRKKKPAKKLEVIAAVAAHFQTKADLKAFWNRRLKTILNQTRKVDKCVVSYSLSEELSGYNLSNIWNNSNHEDKTRFIFLHQGAGFKSCLEHFEKCKAHYNALLTDKHEPWIIMGVGTDEWMPERVETLIKIRDITRLKSNGYDNVIETMWYFNKDGDIETPIVPGQPWDFFTRFDLFAAFFGTVSREVITAKQGHILMDAHFHRDPKCCSMTTINCGIFETIRKSALIKKSVHAGRDQSRNEEHEIDPLFRRLPLTAPENDRLAAGLEQSILLCHPRPYSDAGSDPFIEHIKRPMTVADIAAVRSNPRDFVKIIDLNQMFRNTMSKATLNVKK